MKFDPGDSPRSIEQIRGHEAVYRIALAPEGRATPTSVILKLGTRSEHAVQTLISSALTDVVPAVYGDYIETAELPVGIVGMVMEDFDACCRSVDALDDPDRTVAQFVAFERAILILATVHALFRERSLCQLLNRNVTYPLSAAVAEVPDLLRLLVGLGVALSDSVIAEVAAIGSHFEQYVSYCRSSPYETVVHGDFHPANVLSSAGGDVRIADWARAGIGVAEWDLVMCGENQVQKYLDARPLRPCVDAADGSFSSRLRSAVVVRMYEFICATIRVLFGGTNVRSPHSLLMLLPVYVDRLVEAANSPNFLGGDPVRLTRGFR